MKTVVLKFGGTSVGSINRIKKVCKIIATYKKKKYNVVVISSAMSGVTNDLVNKSKSVSNNFDLAEYDALLSTGEQVSCALIAGRLNHIGLKSRSWLSWQLPIVTEGNHSGARINKINIKELNKYIKENIIRQFKIKNKNKPLSGINILDIGCGGGLLSEPMCRLGANVTGIDASIKNIKISKLHAKKDNLKINYICSSPEKLKISKKFDVILNMEIVEHVEDISFFLKSCSKLLNKNGLMFVATINKTLKSYVFAIVGAEYVLRWLPIGTHDWEKFVKPEELKEILSKNNLSLKKLDGMHFNIIKDEWSISKDLSINYIAKFLKN